MKKVSFLLAILLPFFCSSQLSRKGVYAGAGINSSYVNTHYYFHSRTGNPYVDNYPGHSITRTNLVLSLEKRSVYKLKTLFYDAENPDRKWYFDYDLGTELQLGLAGKTRADWIGDDDVISGGGMSAGLLAWFRALLVYPGRVNKERNTSIFISLGPQVNMIRNNGKGVSDFASRPGLNYTDGWNEYVAALNLSVGIQFDFAWFDITPEIRFIVPGAGFAFTNWNPNGNVKSNGAPSGIAYSIRFSKQVDW